MYIKFFVVQNLPKMLHFVTKLAKIFINRFSINMRITPINIQHNYISFQPQNKEVVDKYGFEKTIQVNYTAEPTFQSHSVKYLKAKNYLSQENLKRQSKGFLKEAQDIFSYNLNKLDGIQEGIKVFKNLTMKEIAFILTTVSEFALIRGCRNNCTHCYADAKPPVKNSESMTNSMLWEDFISLTKGIKELNQRLGFNISGNLKHNKGRYLTTFHDSDGSDIVIKDCTGIEHDYIDIAKKLHDAMGVKVIFDTAGWNLTDKKAQNRMEKFVEYYSDSQNSKVLDDINISFNPFHSIYTKSIELEKAGKKEMAKKMHNIYIDRMANVLYTFTPLLKYKNFNILSCTLPNENIYKGFTISETLNLFQEILDKLEQLYIKDFNGEQKIIKSKDDININLHEYYENLAARYITFSEKAKNFFGINNSLFEEADDKFIESLKYLETEPSSIDKYRNYFVGIIDSNGKYYLTNYELSVPTELKLNFNNNKETAPIKPYLMKEKIVTRSEINKF